MNSCTVLRVRGTGGNVRRGMPGGAEIVGRGPGARAADIDEVKAVGEVAGLVRRLARDLDKINKAADVGEHFCVIHRQKASTIIKAQSVTEAS